MRNSTTRKRLLSIAEKYISGKATATEKDFLETYYDYFEAEDEYLDKLGLIEAETIGTDIKAEIDRAINPPKVKRMPVWPKWVAAASVLLLISIGILFLKRSTYNKVAEQIMPLHKGVMLTLNNGKSVSIDKAPKGIIKLANGAVVKNTGNALDYSGESNNDITPQTLTNNTGATFKLILADRTEVYLDVNSSLTFPAAFKGERRDVSITGQAYFKVVHNARMPFSVKAGGETVQDIGTEFDVNNYSSFKVTLAEGAISLRDKTLKPGTLAVIEKNAVVIRPADIETETAWIHDKIVFDHATLDDIFNEVSHVYGVKINWQDAALKQLKFGGTLSRTNKLYTILNFFRKTGEVSFKVEDHTLYIQSPQ